jgi:hypothetical protein
MLDSTINDKDTAELANIIRKMRRSFAKTPILPQNPRQQNDYRRVPAAPPGKHSI